ncbi:hypothetical protein WICPIJ_004936 [Wickerhamomyces pijperi]|uniref:Uncharacterized protein n=1 Tax=Wickerhamomyces pijperi TaxID=599730 RepID=A0A9P8TMU1_WICPI|nr:hypothetical protein WICPIJ_004936 [Wickerhamomyces pijperi]
MKCSKHLHIYAQRLLFNSNFLIFTNLNKSIDNNDTLLPQQGGNVTSDFETYTKFYDSLNLIVIKDIDSLFSLFKILSKNPSLVKEIKSFKVHLVDLSIHNADIHFQRSIGFKNYRNLVNRKTIASSQFQDGYLVHKDGVDLSFDVSCHSFQIQTRNIKKLYNFTLDTLIQDHRDRHKLQHPKLFTVEQLKTKKITETFEKRRKPVKSHDDFKRISDTETIILHLENTLKRHFIFMPDDKTFPVNSPQTLKLIEYIKHESLSHFTKIFNLKVTTRPHNSVNSWSFELVALNNAQIQSNGWNRYYHPDDDHHEFAEGESRELSQLRLKSFGLDITKLKKDIELITMDKLSCGDVRSQIDTPASFVRL